MDEILNITTAALLPKINERLKLAQSIFDLWFGEMKLSELTGTTAVFLTTSKLRRQILSTKYKDVVSECLKEVIGFSVDVSFECDGDSSDFSEDEVIETTEEDKEEAAERERKIREMLEDKSGGRGVVSEYTFENFIEGASNKFARAACLAVAKEPTTYNPLFIHGHSGLGKTHLLYAVINEIRQNYPELKIVYKKSEDFVNELIKAIEEGSTAEFKEHYRTADVLLLDDIQFIAGKESTQEEFFHTFSSLYEADKQIILTSDRPPKDIRPLEDRLRTRFEGGLIADVQPPSFELRTAIIKKKASSLGMDLSNELIEYMAERLHSNIRQIEGVIKRLHAVSSIQGLEINKECVENAISIIDPGNIPTSVLVEKILNVVSREYGVSVDAMKSKKKSDSIAKARHRAIYILRQIGRAHV